MRRRLGRTFFRKRSIEVAQKLLGKYLVRKIGRRFLVGNIVETEAYPGPFDRASHAFGFKRTPRNRAEYLEGGHVYIYLVYGMYWQLNISTGHAGYPECVLIRALEPIIHLKSKNLNLTSMVANGPGKLCRWLKLNKSFYGEDVTKSKRLWFEVGDKKIPRVKIISGPRIGIDYAGPRWAKKPWRFSINKRVNRWVSEAG